MTPCVDLVWSGSKWQRCGRPANWVRISLIEGKRPLCDPHAREMRKQDPLAEMVPLADGGAR